MKKAILQVFFISCLLCVSFFSCSDITIPSTQSLDSEFEYNNFRGIQFAAFNPDGEQVILSEDILERVIFGDVEYSSEASKSPAPTAHYCGHSPTNGCGGICYYESYYYNAYVHSSNWTFAYRFHIIRENWNPPGPDPSGTYAVIYELYYCDVSCCTITVNLCTGWIPA